MNQQGTYPLRAGQTVTVYLTQDLAGLLNELAEMRLRQGKPVHEPDIYLTTHATLGIAESIKRAKDLLEKGAAK